jgi:predicted glycosyltransferase involved in capsule biosynthesis
MIESQDIKYSFIISYRDRESHLSSLIPRLNELMESTTYEIIVAEQDNQDKFQKNSLYNLAAQVAKGQLFIFHDVDYYPSDNVSYNTDENTPLYPVRNVVFLNKDNTQRDVNDIPAGYRNFINDVGDHSGGVFVIHRNLFFKTNGLNPYYKGWGKEDDDTRDRLRLLGYNWKRNDKGLFYGLYHTDNKPKDDDIDFINNHYLLANLKNTLNVGYSNVKADIDEYNADGVRWLKIKNFKYEN